MSVEHNFPGLVMEDMELNLNGMCNLLLKLDVTFCGTDGIPNAFLKRYVEMISIYLLVLFKASLDQVCLPLDWFCGNVVVHKDGSKLLSTNYSSISLISICCKLLEHVISSYITSFLEMHSILVYFQHGPRSGYQLQLHFFQSCMAS